MDKITTEAAKSILRVMLAKAVADSVVGVQAVMEEQENPLTEIQKIELTAVAMMGYRQIADEAEESVDAQVTMDQMREAVNAPRKGQWATEQEARQNPGW